MFPGTVVDPTHAGLKVTVTSRQDIVTPRTKMVCG